MNILDIINSIFGLIGGLASWLNVYQVIKDKRVHGVNWISSSWWILYGIWDLYYYQNLGQKLSFTSGVVILTGQLMWYVIAQHYWRRQHAKTAKPAAQVQAEPVKPVEPPTSSI